MGPTAKFFGICAQGTADNRTGVSVTTGQNGKHETGPPRSARSKHVRFAPADTNIPEEKARKLNTSFFAAPEITILQALRQEANPNVIPLCQQVPPNELGNRRPGRGRSPAGGRPC